MPSFQEQLVPKMKYIPNAMNFVNQSKSSSLIINITAWKVSKYVVISGPYFPVFGLNTEI